MGEKSRGPVLKDVSLASGWMGPTNVFAETKRHRPDGPAWDLMEKTSAVFWHFRASETGGEANLGEVCPQQRGYARKSLEPRHVLCMQDVGSTISHGIVMNDEAQKGSLGCKKWVRGRSEHLVGELMSIRIRIIC